MALWRIALTPPRGSQRARPRWLCGDGLFRLQRERAWTVADPAIAGQRLQQWLLLHGHHSTRLERLHLVAVPPGERSAAGKTPPGSAEASA